MLRLRTLSPSREAMTDPCKISALTRHCDALSVRLHWPQQAGGVYSGRGDDRSGLDGGSVLPYAVREGARLQGKRDDEREFYLRLCIQERWHYRQLERQIAGAFFERVVLSPTKLSAPLRELHPEAATAFKESYLVEFLTWFKPRLEFSGWGRCRRRIYVGFRGATLMSPAKHPL